MCNYPEYVRNISSIPSIDILGESNKRFCLSIDIDDGDKFNRNECVSVIMMNPSKATNKKSDISVNRIIGYVNKNKDLNKDLKNIKRIYILNLYSSYETNSENLNLNINEKENNKCIEEKITSSKFVILAFGKPQKIKANNFKIYKNRIQEVINIINKTGREKKHIGELTKDNLPRHARTIGYSYEMKDFQ